ncbi:hypothetical protein GDO81_017970 [Engystomops pustulosus]|uniref:Uncharacterized protein n=1 Tax=Engystomops pustulosus TaxID=76066 RepID=A0AAV7A9T4_ENGPU|nr:hypothetical protein GDO81_017970 [Engystomops pustulosus]
MGNRRKTAKLSKAASASVPPSDDESIPKAPLLHSLEPLDAQDCSTSQAVLAQIQSNASKKLGKFSHTHPCSPQGSPNPSPSLFDNSQSHSLYASRTLLTHLWCLTASLRRCWRP